MPARATLAGAPRVARPGPQRVAVVINPVKAQAVAARMLVARACADAGWPEPTIRETTIAAPGGPQAQAALADGADVVVVGGGDGTVRAVAAVLARSGVAMGVLALGTANLLSRNLGLARSGLEAQVRTALFGAEQPIDIGMATVEYPGRPGHEPETTTQVFLVLAGMGMDARAVAGTRERLKRRLGWLAYGEAGLRHLHGPLIPVTIGIDEAPAAVRMVRSVLVGNCGLIPAGIDIIPGALLDDGVLDVVLMAPSTPLGWGPIAGKVLFRHRYKVRSLHYHPARTVMLRPPYPVEVQVDGDVVGVVSALTVRVAPHALTVRVPAP